MRQLYSYWTCLVCLVSLLSSCQKEISLENNNDSARDSLPIISPPVTSPIDPAINTWQFIDSNNRSFHHGPIDTADTYFDVNSNWNYLKIVGWPVNSFGISNDTMFLTALFLPHPFIEAGVYDISSGIGGSHIFGFGNNTIVPPYGNNQNFCYYLATPDIAPDFKISIISYDAQQKLLKGSLNGRLRMRASITDYSVTYHTISGSFYLRLSL
jgi:hypothetical protein